MAIAIIPGILIILYVYTKDRVEKEPITLIVKLLIFGAITTILAGYAEAYSSMLFPQYPVGSLQYSLINSFCLAAFWEELLKFLALKIGSWRHPSFNYRFDGIVYGVSTAVGFALLENVMYVAQYGFQTAVVRAFTAVPLHAFCGVFMGIFYAYAKKASILGQGGAKFACNLLALIVPMIIHGIYDTLAFLRADWAFIGLMIFVVFLYIIAISTIRKNSAEDYKAGFYPQARTIEYDTTLTE